MALRKNVASQKLVWLMVDATDFATPETGLGSNVSAYYFKDGGARSTCSNTPSEITSGLYKVSLATTETNGDVMAYQFAGTGCADQFVIFYTDQALTYASDVLSTLDDNVADKLASILADTITLSNATYGLDALETLCSDIKDQTTSILADTITLSNATYGLDALETLCSNIKDETASILVDTKEINSQCDSILADTITLSNATYGLNALETLCSDIKDQTTSILADTITLSNATYGLNALESLTSQILVDTGTTLENRTTSIVDYVSQIESNVSNIISTLDDVVGSQIASILTDTGTTLDNKLDSILVDTGTTLDNKLDSAIVYLNSDITEMAAGAPPASPTPREALNNIYRILRNKIETTSATQKVYDDAGTTVLFSCAVSDDATTFTKGEHA